MLTRSSRYILAGFALVLALMTGVMAIGLRQMSSLSDRLDAIVAKYNARAELIITMRNAARERLIVMHALAIEDDLFARDQLFQRFQQHAVEFTNAREKLEVMRLTPAEKAALERQGDFTRISVGLQEQFLDLVVAERYSDANKLFLERILPAQNQVLAELDEMLAIQRDASHMALEETNRTYRITIISMIGFGAAALVLGLLVAFRVMRTVAGAEDDVFNKKELAEVTLHSIGDAVITTDARGMVTNMNTVAEKLTGWFGHEARGLPLSRTFHAIREVTREPIDFLAQTDLFDNPNLEANHQALVISRDGQEFAIETSLAPIRNREGKTIGMVLIFRDVTKQRFLAQQLTWQASHDALTGLANRPEFQRRLTQLLETAKTGRKHHSLLYIDLDQFKVVNDTCGHGIGDELLRQLAAMLETKIRKGDTLARLGGDEFGVLLENCPLSEAQRIAENLRDAVRGFRFVWMDRVFEVGASIGVVSIDNNSSSPSSILSAADTACYAAKDRGRNRVHLYQPHDSDLLRREGEMHWTTRITQALEEGRLRLRFQRILPLSDRGPREEFREVLLEMVDEAGNPVRAPVFLPAAERYGLMPAVDRWVVKTVLATYSGISRAARANADAAERVLWSINLSGNSLNDDTFLDFLLNEIDESGVPATSLCFEITETAAITNLQKAEHFIAELKKLGCRFALDDFGNGMSSFVYLKNLSVDFLKIDGSFVKDMAHDTIDLAMVEAINRIGHVMGIKTIAECVEDESILEKLKALGVDYVQGEALHKPEPLRASADIVSIEQLKRGSRGRRKERQEQH